MNLDHVIILAASRRRCRTLCGRSPLYVGRFRSTAAASDLLRPPPLHCARSPHTSAAVSALPRPFSALLRPLPLYCGRSPHYCGRSPHRCGRSMSESDCVRSMFRSGVHLWATIQSTKHDDHKISRLKFSRSEANP